MRAATPAANDPLAIMLESSLKDQLPEPGTAGLSPNQQA
jgi:hypothetical protein